MKKIVSYSAKIELIFLAVAVALALALKVTTGKTKIAFAMLIFTEFLTKRLHL
ncbi:hypothetical protein [Treponema pectinovorum]|uniref:hypothetical protein n=1 Tax=Treponema pectinovorum TaxID=164 RepID=UPI00164E6049|nr:hypothetical protein [Treponema pectinovorum]